MYITRLAPSPTGALHLGNARTFLVNWMLARQCGGQVILRIEDLDGPRIKAGADVQLIADLRWLGVDWDQGPIHQSRHREHYAAAVEKLLVRGQAYACICTRSEVELAASAPHLEDGAAVYPGTCRGRFRKPADAKRVCARDPAIRFAVAPQSIHFTDLFSGPHQFSASQLGDFVVQKSDGTCAYQLAVVVDDAAMAITHVVRGDDLVDSTPRQIMLFKALDWTDKIPKYMHLPLVVGSDGRRLAKRHGDTRLSSYRERGFSPFRILGLIAQWCGVEGVEEIDLPTLLLKFDIGRLPKSQIVFTLDENLNESDA